MLMQALTLLFVGMAAVFLFLAMLVLSTVVMSKTVLLMGQRWGFGDDAVVRSPVASGENVSRPTDITDRQYRRKLAAIMAALEQHNRDNR